PVDWHAVPNLFGVPLAVLGPKVAGSRPTIYFIPLGKENTVFWTSHIKSSETEYKANTENSLIRDGAKPIAFIPYKKSRWKHVKEVHSMGYRYEREGEAFVEYTHFVSCGTRLYHVNTILTATQEQQQGATVREILESFACHS